MMSLLSLAVFSIFLFLGESTCPPDECDKTETCCDGPRKGLYGCCPVADAVCCSDGFHCCPHNTFCNITSGSCYEKSGIIHLKPTKKSPTVEAKAAVVQRANQLDVVYCPGGYVYCQDGATCCPMYSGGYSCCPYASATCCADMVHCCPAGTRCDTTSRYCLRGEENPYEALLKILAFPKK